MGGFNSFGMNNGMNTGFNSFNPGFNTNSFGVQGMNGMGFGNLLIQGTGYERCEHIYIFIWNLSQH